LPLTGTGLMTRLTASYTRMPVTNQMVSTDARAPSTSTRWYLDKRVPHFTATAPQEQGTCPGKSQPAGRRSTQRQGCSAIRLRPVGSLRRGLDMQVTAKPPKQHHVVERVLRTANRHTPLCTDAQAASGAPLCREAHPKVCVDWLRRVAYQAAQRLTPKPLTSDSRCAASVSTARLRVNIFSLESLEDSLLVVFCLLFVVTFMMVCVKARFVRQLPPSVDTVSSEAVRNGYVGAVEQH